MNFWAILQRTKKRITGFIQRLRDYSYFRHLGQGVGESWEKSGKTVS